MQTLKDKVIFISGATRGIGRAIALRCAEAGAIIIITGKSDKPHPKLPGTIHSVAEEVRQAGGTALGLALDVRNERDINAVVAEVVATFGRIDVLINNASAISLTPTLETPMRRFDLMFNVNVRATYACSQACLPHLLKAPNPHILNISPPLNMDKKWFKDHLAYTMSKYGMSMCTLGLAEEFREAGVAVNSLWPRTTIATMAIKVHFPEYVWRASREPRIMADAAYHVITSDSRQNSGHFWIDEEILQQQGINDFSAYALEQNTTPKLDLFLEEPVCDNAHSVNEEKNNESNSE